MDGSVLKEYWKLSKLSQKELADKLGITVSALGQQFVAKDLRSGTIEKFCKVMGLTMNKIYKGTEFAEEKSVLGEYLEHSGLGGETTTPPYFLLRFEQLIVENSELKQKIEELQNKLKQYEETPKAKTAL